MTTEMTPDKELARALILNQISGVRRVILEDKSKIERVDPRLIDQLDLVAGDLERSVLKEEFNTVIALDMYVRFMKAVADVISTAEKKTAIAQ